MDVKFITTTSNRLSELPIVSGQLIYLSDINASYYDMGGYRNLMSSMRLVSSLPQSGQDGVLYGVVNASGNVDASVWDSTASAYRSVTGYLATTAVAGLVKPDGTTITIDENGVISGHPEVTTLPASSITYDNTVSGMASTNAQLAFDEVYTVSTGAAESASTAILIGQAAQSAADNASTAASAAQSTADSAYTLASGASTWIASASTVLTDLAQRLTLVEAVASIALTVEDGNVEE